MVQSDLLKWSGKTLKSIGGLFGTLLKIRQGNICGRAESVE